MSLQVWLPLNGNANNQGLSGITMVGSPKSYGVNGKIGKCASFAGDIVNIIYNNTSDFNYTDNFSYCVWINQNYTGTATQWAFTNGRADFGGYGYGIKISNATNIACFFGTKYVNVICPANEWHHIAVTISGTVMKVYKDGVLDSTNSTATLPTYSDGKGLGLGCFHYSDNIYPFYGSLNDFRIYDHCLSPKEVKEISKGLCLHYKLSGPGQENLFTHTSPDEKKSSNEWMQIGNDTTSIFDQYGLVPYTVSFEAKSEIAGDFMLYSTSGSNPKYSWTKTTINLTTDWQYFTYTFTPTLNASDSTWSRISIYGTYETGKIPSIRNAKLELGNIATPWIPNSSDSDYSKMRYDNNIEYDCSGYCRDGTKTGTIIWSSDTKRYCVSSLFDSTSTKIKLPVINFSGFANSYTFSWWEKNSGSDNMPWGFADGNRLNLYHATHLCWNTGDGWSNPFKDSSGTVILNSRLCDNAWHHCVVTGDGTATKLYIDGVYVGSATTYKSITGTQIYLSGFDSSTNYTFSGSSLSDFRIYSTVLSDSDILELYNSPINIDNGNNLYAYEFIEEEENNFSKQGIVKNSEFIDLDTAGNSYTNASISSTVDYANIFIEK